MSKQTSLSAIIAMPSTEDSWVDGSFTAKVTQTKSPNGKAPGRAMLIDPENPAISLSASFFGRDPSFYEGKIVSFGGPGMKKSDYQGKPQISVGQKSHVNIFQDTTEPEAGKHMPAAAAVAPAKPVNFDAEMTKLGMYWTQCLKQALVVQATAKLALNHDMTPDQLQSCIASLFIEGNRRGLTNGEVPSV